MNFAEIVIPELDEAAARYVPYEWSDEQIAVLKTYWRKVPVSLLEKYVHHSVATIDRKAADLGLPPRRR